VINIVTKKKASRAISGHLEYSYGSFNTNRGRLALAGQTAQWDYAMNLGGTISEGGYLFEDLQSGQLEQRHNTGLHLLNGGASLGWYFMPQQKISAALQASTSQKGVPGMVDFPTVAAQLTHQRYTSQLDYQWQLPGRFLDILQAGIYYNYQQNHYQDPQFYLGAINNRHLNQATGSELLLNGNWQFFFPHKFQFVYNYRYDWLLSDALLQHDKINTAVLKRQHHSFFLQDAWHWWPFAGGPGRLVLIPSLNYTWHSYYPQQLTWQTGAIINFQAKRLLVFKANIGTNYRLPDFDDLFWPATAFAVGNPQLKPERIFNWDSGFLARPFTWLNLELVYFESRTEDLIQWNPGQGGLWRPQNLDLVHSQGIESEVKGFWPLDFISSNLEVRANYTLQLSHQILSEQPPTKDQRYLPRRPLETANFIISFSRHQTYLLRWETRFCGFRYLTAANTKYLPAYLVHNLNARVTFWRHWYLGLQVNNILDEYYVDLREYPIPGREITVSSGVRF
jgi:outer membrane receptor protein involved in Fe transport